ncbi:hypothetical protein LOK74_16905 [Brevibacillus humidisoli]|uniref:hypothetical protein n=1 Tax=Brevibacillus humidisoli TaxID=2895522 RepID=UPI001E4FBE0C|nr:hypothetical protein LOK74_16905 [Brevibacillus humidisoli]
MFRAKVVDIEQRAENLVVTLKADRSWKGEIPSQVIVHTALHEASCGFGFEEGKEYLVYATNEKGQQWETSLCSRTSEITNAEEDLSFLGTGTEMKDGQTEKDPADAGQEDEPDHVSNKNESSTPARLYAASGILIAGVLVALIIILLRRNRNVP